MTEGANSSIYDFSPLALHIIYLLNEELLGRRTLTTRTGNSESTVRTELENLRELNYLQMDRQGTELSSQGQQVFKPLFGLVIQKTELSLVKLSIDKVHVGSLIELKRGLEKPSWHYRDLCIAQGATGTIVLGLSDGTIRFCGTDEKLVSQNPMDEQRIRDSFDQLQRGDYIIISSASSPEEAWNGLWNIHRELLSESDRSFFAS